MSVIPGGSAKCWTEDRSVPGKAIIGVDCAKGEGVLFVVDYTGTGGEVRFCPACGSPVVPWADRLTIEVEPNGGQS